MERKKFVRLEFLPTHHCETVAVDARPQKGRFDLTKGWREFRAANKLEYGKTYSYELKPNEDVIYVKEVIGAN